VTVFDARPARCIRCDAVLPRGNAAGWLSITGPTGPALDAGTVYVCGQCATPEEYVEAEMNAAIAIDGAFPAGRLVLPLRDEDLPNEEDQR
jgi:hypothetical protein